AFNNAVTLFGPACDIFTQGGVLNSQFLTTNQTNYAFNQSRFTAKGVRWVGGLWAEYVAKGQIA
ncbi:hypothetical protein UXP82_22900, partial [Enterobacter hormaechei]